MQNLCALKEENCHRIHELTGGSSLEANTSLVENNAKFGADIAVHLAQIRSAQGVYEPSIQFSRTKQELQTQVKSSFNFQFV